MNGNPRKKTWRKDFEDIANNYQDMIRCEYYVMVKRIFNLACVARKAEDAERDKRHAQIRENIKFYVLYYKNIN